MERIKKYLRISKNVMQTLSAYRLQFLVFIISSPLYIIISYFLWKNVFEFGGYQSIVGYTFEQMIAYTAFQMSLGGGLTFVTVDFRIGKDVNSGEIVVPLLKPYKYILSQMAIALGGKAFFLLLVYVPLIIFGAIFFFMVPKNPAYLMLSLVVLGLGFVLNFMFSFCVGLSSCWIKEYKGLGRLKRGIVRVLSGRYMPLSLFPEPILSVLNILPFSYLAFAPANIFLGKMDYLGCINVIIIELVWILVFYVLYRIIWKYARKQITGVGI